MIAKEGKKIIITALVLTVLIIIATVFYPFIPMKFISILFIIFSFLIIYFFRDPERKINYDRDVVVSPSDGRVVAYDEIEDQYVGNAKLISIFMTILDVHINRMPDDGKIISDEWISGKYISSYNPASSFVNERRRINIESSGNRRYGVTQIAGMIARRIVPFLTKGDLAKKGEKFGMIKFGSRVDIVMPADIVVQVTLNQKLKAGETIIGIYK